MFIAVDPGENVGVATFKEDGSDIKRTIIKLPEFRRVFLKFTMLEVQRHVEAGIKLKFIMEDYHLRQDMALNQTGSDMPASRCIGAVEMVVDILGELAELYLVKPGNLRTALKWAGFPELANKPRSWHCPDDLAAYAHGKMWLIQNDICKHPIFGN